MKQSAILITKSDAGYELIDSGEGDKLERFGDFVLSRPDPQALWKKNLPDSEWKKAQGQFTRSADKGEWKMDQDVPKKWSIEFGGLKLWIKPTAFKHTGLFPEQAMNWEWLRKVISESAARMEEVSEVGPPRRSPRGPTSDTSSPRAALANDIDVLNLFGYTGGATLTCAQAGAKVVHVDGSKVAMSWARENAELSGLDKKPIRWIIDDAHTFVKREIKRGKKYHGIIMDPPAFGHGPDGEVWQIEDNFLPLIEDCMKILSDKPLFFLINGYSAGYSAIAYENNLLPLIKKYGGSIEIGELTIEESKGGRLLPCGIFARWSL